MSVQQYDVELIDVSKRYGSSTVLDSVNLTIAHGERIVILGRSGTGKSTLLNLIGSLDEPDQGAVMLFGERVSTMREKQRSILRARRIGFVFQFFNLIPTLTARENVELPLALNGTPRSETRSRALALLEELDLGAGSSRFPEELSGGEQQRVAIARAVVHDPELLLADEPTGNLDADTGRVVLGILDDLCRRRGTTLILATHSDEVAAIADRRLRIHNSKVHESQH